MQMNNNMQMKNYWEHLFPIFILLTFFISGCADPTFIGGDVLEDDRIDVGYTDTISIRSRTIRGDSVLTYSSRPVWLNAHLFGDFKDPVLGSTYTEIYGRPTLEVNSVSYFSPDFEGAQLDSIILVLPYSSRGFYGNTEEEFTIEVYETVDTLSRDSSFYSNKSLDLGSFIGNKSFIPRLDSITFIDYRNTTPDTVSLAQLRVPLTGEFGNRLINADTNSYTSNRAFQQFLKGLAIRPATTTNGMISFDLVPSNGNYDAGIYVYFRRDTVPTQYRFPLSFGSAIASYMENDYAGSVAEPFIDSDMFSDSIGFVQGTEGLLLELEFPNLEGLKDVIVNKAELVVPVVNYAGDDRSIYFPAEQLFAYFYNTETNSFSPLDDVLLPAPSVLNAVFGGVLETGSNGDPDVYRMNISVYFQEMLKDDRETDVKDVIYLTVAPRSERVSRSILYGGSHPQHPIKLNLSYTTQ